MTIHTFGAYFGLVVTRVLYRPNLDKSKHRNSSVYHSDLFAMIGKSLEEFTHLNNSILWSTRTLWSTKFWVLLRYHLSVDVLAQLQLRYYKLRWPTAQNCHEHLLLSGRLHTGYIRFLRPSQPRRQIGHGEYLLVANITLQTASLQTLLHASVFQVHIQNAALAGGVAVGTAGEMMLTAFGSMIVGFLAGTISVLGYKYLTVSGAHFSDT